MNYAQNNFGDALRAQQSKSRTLGFIGKGLMVVATLGILIWLTVKVADELIRVEPQYQVSSIK